MRANRERLPNGAFDGNPYEILGIPDDSDRDAIVRAYRIFAFQYHPDRTANKSPEERARLEEEFKLICWACNEALDNLDNMSVGYGHDPAEPVDPFDYGYDLERLYGLQGQFMRSVFHWSETVARETTKFTAAWFASFGFGKSPSDTHRGHDGPG
ncbi:MAG: J domain-containing protein [Alphaproteobacteria bacterium]|nr:J domain-containing protein [Alphaproteobacteria bacterium]